MKLKLKWDFWAKSWNEIEIRRQINEENRKNKKVRGKIFETFHEALLTFLEISWQFLFLKENEI